ncbi:MAG TPA: hypothetical protein PLB01_05070 [Thermoanaerobaculia bacterium]|nr:hypothetical protein [Thermoanaerobaculia bacterium]
MCLIAAELEGRGIATTSVTALPEVTRKVGIPRALAVPYALGYPLGLPHDAVLQTKILVSAFGLLRKAGPPPVVRDF